MYPYWNTWHPWNEWQTSSNHNLYQQYNRLHPGILTQYLQQLFPRPPVSPIPPFQIPQSILPTHMQTQVPTPAPTHVPTPTPAQLHGPAPANIAQQIANHHRWIDFYRGLLATETDPTRRGEIQNRLITHMTALSYLQSLMRATT